MTVDSALKLALSKLLNSALKRAGTEYDFEGVDSFHPREIDDLRPMFASLKDRQAIYLRARYHIQKFIRKF